MNILDLLEGQQVLIENPVEVKNSVLKIKNVEELIKEEMQYDDGWENGNFKKIRMGFLITFMNGYKRKYTDLMDIVLKNDLKDFLDTPAE